MQINLSLNDENSPAQTQIKERTQFRVSQRLPLRSPRTNMECGLNWPFLVAILGGDSWAFRDMEHGNEKSVRSTVR